MVARSESMFGCYDSYSYRLWSLANVWSNCNFPALTNGLTSKDGDKMIGSDSYFIKCPQCQKGYPSFQALKEHMEITHPAAGSEDGSTTPLPPPSASASPPPPPNATALLGTGGPLPCSQCNASFSNKDQLEKHELLHSPNAQVSCKICHKTFANVYRLQRHMISHDESALLRKFKCTQCEKAFKFKHHLKEHIRIHSGEKPFECGNCGKRFSHSGSYSSHMTSKKCLVMNLKLGRTRAPSASSVLDKPQTQINRGPKRPLTTGPPLNNNISTSPNHNAFLPILPKYSEAATAAFLSAMASRDANYSNPPTSLPTTAALHPFYMATAPNMHLNGSAISPYSMPTSLSHLLEQLQASTPHKHPALSESHSEQIKQESDDHQSDHGEENDEHDVHNKSSSSCGDLVMDIDDHENENKNEERESSVDRERISPGADSNSGDLEAVKRILETVNATVTKQLLQANMQKLTSSSPSCSPTLASPALPIGHNSSAAEYNLKCTSCYKHFEDKSDLDQHQCSAGEQTEVKSEGLAAKLEEAVTVKTEEMSIHGTCSGSEEDVDDDNHHIRSHEEYDMDGESVSTGDHDQTSEDGRKVRVRSLIADEQLAVLKDHYSVNPRPKREELARIAERIGFPVRVVQVWFQNTRARDRREGRLVHVPYSPIQQTPMPCFPPSIVPSSVPLSMPALPYPHPTSPQYPVSSEQPLDLSTKKGPMSTTSSPSCSPQRPRSVTAQSESGEEAVNLSRKSSRSPTPFHQTSFQQVHYQNSNCSSDFQRSPSPVPPETINNSSRLARILAKPTHRITMGNVGGPLSLLPMEHLLQYQPDMNMARSPLLNTSSSSPGSERRSWKLEEAEDSGVSQEIDTGEEDLSAPSKRIKLPQLALKNLHSTTAGSEPEPEGQFICDQCDKAFSKQSSLARHKYEHSGQRPHKCDECPKAFKHKHHLTEHKRLHSGEKPFQCCKCLKRFSHSGSYSQHMNHRYSYCKPYRE